MLNCPVALVVSSDRQVRRLISASLGQIGCTSLDVATGREGSECAGAAHVDLVIVDVCMPDGFESSRTNIASDHGVGNARRSIAITCGRSA